MGFDLLLITTGANGLRVPFDAKCCFCRLLLDDGVSLSGCGHSACYACMTARAQHSSTCPVDGCKFDMKQCRYLQRDIHNWLMNIRLKCRFFDGTRCTATGIALRNVRRHEEVCPNVPNKRSLATENYTKPGTGIRNGGSTGQRHQQQQKRPVMRIGSSTDRSGRTLNKMSSSGRSKPVTCAVGIDSGRQQSQRATEMKATTTTNTTALKFDTSMIEKWIKDLAVKTQPNSLSSTDKLKEAMMSAIASDIEHC